MNAILNENEKLNAIAVAFFSRATDLVCDSNKEVSLNIDSCATKETNIDSNATKEINIDINAIKEVILETAKERACSAI